MPLLQVARTLIPQATTQKQVPDKLPPMAPVGHLVLVLETACFYAVIFHRPPRFWIDLLVDPDSVPSSTGSSLLACPVLRQVLSSSVVPNSAPCLLLSLYLPLSLNLLFPHTILRFPLQFSPTCRHGPPGSPGQQTLTGACLHPNGERVAPLQQGQIGIRTPLKQFFLQSLQQTLLCHWFCYCKGMTQRAETPKLSQNTGTPWT